ncbi:MAG TPA: META domain-containing protein [Pyrinomonadaceae bacterium]|nr:META domain-containing protein [Pyrinomonadaceae bacterium]
MRLSCVWLAVLCLGVAVIRTTSAHQDTNLGGTSWQLVKFQSMDDTTLTPDDRSKYTIAFATDGGFTVRFDCNRGRGTWKSTGPTQLQFGPLALTRAMCGPGSLHDQLVRQWPNIRSYVLRDGHLFLALLADGGIYEFEPIAAARSLTGTKWRLTEVNGMALNTHNAYLEFDEKTNSFSGNGGCNRIAGSYKVDGARIKFSQGITTQMACIDNDLHKLETNFLNNLNQVSDFQIAGDLLRLTAGTQPKLTFSADTSASSGAPAAGQITGTVSFRQRIGLTPSAVIQVKLVDVSRAGAASTTIAEQTIRPAGSQVPIPFAIQFDPSRINPRNRYTVQARILENGRLRFVNSQAYLVLTGGFPTTVNVLVTPVGRR